MELTIDTASSLTGVALSEAGVLVAEYSWRSGRRHAAELLPAVEAMLSTAGVERGAIDAVFVNRGPGAYGGLRVGISTALALAFALDADVLGYGRLEADAAPLLGAGMPVAAVHDAGRGELAWAVYSRGGADVTEVQAPRIGPPEALVAAMPPGVLVVGEAAPLAGLLPAGTPVIDTSATQRRAVTGAALAWRRYSAGARDSRLALTPIYLREPNITAPRPSRGSVPASA